MEGHSLLQFRFSQILASLPHRLGVANVYLYPTLQHSWETSCHFGWLGDVQIGHLGILSQSHRSKKSYTSEDFWCNGQVGLYGQTCYLAISWVAPCVV